MLLGRYFSHFHPTSYSYHFFPIPAALPTCSIQVTEVTFTMVTVQWGTCVGVDPYYLTIEPNDDGLSDPSIAASDPLEYTFSNLNPGTQYTFGVYSDGNSPYAIDSVYTGGKTFAALSKKKKSLSDLAESSTALTKV